MAEKSKTSRGPAIKGKLSGNGYEREWETKKPRRRGCDCRYDAPDLCVATKFHVPVDSLASSDHCICRCHDEDGEWVG